MMHKRLEDGPPVESLDRLVGPFIEAVRNRDVEIYNEFSLQHELGIFLRNCQNQSVVQFERHIKYFFPTIASDAFTKREIDIAIFNREPRSLEWAIELKYPRNGQGMANPLRTRWRRLPPAT